MKKQQNMIRKQALATLIAFFLEYAYSIRRCSEQQFAEDEPLREQVHQAILVLTSAIHGQPDLSKQAPYLCNLCHLHYANWGHVQITDDRPSKTRNVACCSSCLKQIQADGRLIQPQEQEVPQS